MTISNDLLKNYISAKKELMDYFKCEDDFFIKPFENLKWAVKSDDDFNFLIYWNDSGKKHTAVIVKKNGSAMIFKANKYTMVIAIDCVKTAFIFSNDNYEID